MKTETWCFTHRELERPEQCRGDDEFMALLAEEFSELAVLVYRNGECSDRYAGGSVGVPEEVRELAEAEETLYTLDGEDYANVWPAVHVNNDGSFAGFVED